PMIRYMLRFCLCPPERLSEAKQKKWDQDHDPSARGLASKLNTLGDFDADVTPPRTAAFLAFVQEARKHGGRVNSLWMEEKLVDDEKTQLEWFEIDPQDNSGLDCLVWNLSERITGKEPCLNIKPDRMKFGSHVAGWNSLVYVSERFKSV